MYHLQLNARKQIAKQASKVITTATGSLWFLLSIRFPFYFLVSFIRFPSTMFHFSLLRHIFMVLYSPAFSLLLPVFLTIFYEHPSLSFFTLLNDLYIFSGVRLSSPPLFPFSSLNSICVTTQCINYSTYSHHHIFCSLHT